MYQYIKGYIEDICRDYIVLENNGIGYKIYIPNNMINKLNKSNDIIKIYTYLQIKEDAHILYGFLNKDELDMFELLISVSGIGPKAALSILSTMQPSKIILSIIGNDIKTFTSVPGIGSKTASRLILELKDKMKAYEISDDKNINLENNCDNDIKEIINALLALGYNRNEINGIMYKINMDNKDIETIIKEALKLLMK